MCAAHQCWLNAGHRGGSGLTKSMNGANLKSTDRTFSAIGKSKKESGSSTSILKFMEAEVRKLRVAWIVREYLKKKKKR